VIPFCVIFDIDGVVVDSEQLHFDVLKSMLPQQTSGIAARDLIGFSLEETLLCLGIDVGQHDKIQVQIVRAYKSMLGPHYLRPGIHSLIQSLIINHIRFGFVSTAPREICQANLAILNLPYEPPLISCNDIERTKPYPDPYLLMLKHLCAHPDQTIVIEDTDLGIKAATEAGIRHVYGWPHALSDKQSYARAFKVINSLDEIYALNAIMNAV